MENQHQPIEGYRDLTDAEIAAINELKRAAAIMEEAITRMPLGADQRWLAIGRTACQQGVMALVRAIAKPTTF